MIERSLLHQLIDCAWYSSTFISHQTQRECKVEVSKRERSEGGNKQIRIYSEKIEEKRQLNG